MSLVKFILGTFCLLSSDKASEFVDFQESAILKVDEPTFNKVFNSCHNIIQGLCISSNSVNDASDIVNGKIHFQ